MNSEQAIKNLEVHKKHCESQSRIIRNKGLSGVFLSMIQVADEQIELYKVGKGRLQSNF